MEEHTRGREEFISNNVYDAMELLFSENEKSLIRLNAHKSIERLLLNSQYTEYLVDRGIIPRLISCFLKEINEIQVLFFLLYY